MPNSTLLMPMTIALTMLLFATVMPVSASDSMADPEALPAESSEEECYCNVRKRRQVEQRLQKKRRLESENMEQDNL